MSEQAGDWRVQRCFRLAAAPADDHALAQWLREQPGVHQVAVDGAGRRVDIGYLVTSTDYQALERLLDEAGCPPATGWWSRLRSGWYQNLDLNARDNAKQPPSACCNKPPPGSRH